MNQLVKEPASRLLLHEATDASGHRDGVWLELTGGGHAFGLRVGDADVIAVPAAVLAGVMRRYGRPLADDTVVNGAHLSLATGERVTLMRHLARFDVIAKDYVVYEVPGVVALAELATAVSAALCFLAQRLQSRPDG